MQLFKNTNDIELVDKKFKLLTTNFQVHEDVVNFGVPSIQNILEYDIQDFFLDVNHILKTISETDPNLKGITFNHENVYDEPGDAVDVKYNIELRTPGTMSANSQPHAGKQQYKFKVLDVLDDLDNPGYGVIVSGMFMDNTVFITPWAKTYTTANRVAMALEDLIPDYRWFFEGKGLQHLWFLGRESDTFQNFEQNTLFGCPLKFYVRTLKIKKVYEKKLEEIIVTLYNK